MEEDFFLCQRLVEVQRTKCFHGKRTKITETAKIVNTVRADYVAWTSVYIRKKEPKRNV